VDIVIDQEDTIYRYKCNEQCDNCPMRYVCWTHRKDGNTLHLKGQSYLDPMTRARVGLFAGNQETLCPWCYRIEKKDVARKLGETCPTCGHYITCDSCIRDCNLRNDLYNTDGDCLAEK